MKPFKFLRTSPCPIRCYGGEKGVPQIINYPHAYLNFFLFFPGWSYTFGDIISERCTAQMFLIPSWETFLNDNRDNYIFIYKIIDYDGGFHYDIENIPLDTQVLVYGIIKSEYDNED